ncbi:MAG: hypothetical protein GY761_04620 [Hyphomicrobiales bacterium]|nr:hypothetical protein [Hyphomicrobiales bacterium]
MSRNWREPSARPYNGLSELCQYKVPDASMIHDAWGRNYSTEPSWAQWIQASSGKTRTKNKELVISDTSMAIAAAKNGMGIALVPKSLVADDLRNDSLLAPLFNRTQVEKSLCLHLPNARSQYLILQQFLEFPDVI